MHFILKTYLNQSSLADSKGKKFLCIKRVFRTIALSEREFLNSKTDKCVCSISGLSYANNLLVRTLFGDYFFRSNCL